jgi:DNA-directed RNA polymerase subunit alpha
MNTAPAAGTNIKQIVLGGGSFGPRDVEQMTACLSDDSMANRNLREAVSEMEMSEDRSPAAAVRLGVCYYLLGRYSQAAETLKKGDGGALALYYLGRTYAALDQFDQAAENYQAAARAGYDADTCALARAEALRLSGNATEALDVLDKLSGAVEQTAEYLYQRGATVAALSGSPSEVTALYERAVAADPKHSGALFGLAIVNDRHGNDEVALDLYERSVSRYPAHIGSLINLGILYEDRGQYERAWNCFQRVLESYPNHPRARLYLKDVQAVRDVFFDEDEKRKRDRLSQVLSVPVTDFELSVRSRNCLQKMGVMTLGDLAKTTENDLLASKNFGETSLVEIREMMAAKGLSLGMLAKDAPAAIEEPIYEPEVMTPDEQALLDRPISDLNLSVRARKCMVRLGINTIGELVRRTGDDLLECKNFGVTSLNEVREKLTLKNLKLRGD